MLWTMSRRWIPPSQMLYFSSCFFSSLLPKQHLPSHTDMSYLYRLLTLKAVVVNPFCLSSIAVCSFSSRRGGPWVFHSPRLLLYYWASSLHSFSSLSLISSAQTYHSEQTPPTFWSDSVPRHRHLHLLRHSLTIYLNQSYLQCSSASLITSSPSTSKTQLQHSSRVAPSCTSLYSRSLHTRIYGLGS